MPPLILEDPDEDSSIGTSGTETVTPVVVAEEHHTLAPPRTSPRRSTPARQTVSPPKKPVAGVHTETIHGIEIPVQDTSMSEELSLAEQLQRSAQEGMSEHDGETGAGVGAEIIEEQAEEDVSMPDVDAEAEPDSDLLDQDVDAQPVNDGSEDRLEETVGAEQPEQGSRDAVSDRNEKDAEEEAESPDQADEDADADHEDDEQVASISDDADAEEESASESKFDAASASGSDSDASERNENEEAEVEDVSSECMFCKQAVVAEDDEEQSHLSCAVCSNRAHANCARDEDVVKEENTASWHCPNCLEKTTSQSESPKEQTVRSKNSAPRLVRDLLPVTRGVQKPNSHSIFAQPLISEGEEGGRSLRKRKSPTQEPIPMDKRRRKATERAVASTATPSIAASLDDSIAAVAHATRRSSLLKVNKPTARILQHRPFNKPPPHKFILAFRLDQEKIESILTKPARPGRRRDRKALQKKKELKIPPPIYQPPVPKFPALPTHNLIFPSAFTDREAELNAKPYGGVLADGDADTSRSLPQLKDREIFEIARKEAEDERRRTSAAAELLISGGAEAAAAAGAASTKPNRPNLSGPPSKIKCIQFGKHVIDTFYAAPYPEEYSHESRLFICEFCLKYLPSEFVAYRHKLKCPAKHPPGDEIYRDGTISVWEVDGRKKTEYCQCLCLMAKMFLGSKTLYYDVEPFLFYILTEYDELGYHFVGYFSKEKRPASQNNVSCILVMPIHQRKGYATFLIDFSYLLTRIEQKEGSPEKPLSDMGLTAYRSYWDLTISRHLLALYESKTPFSTKTLMRMTGMTADDVIHSLERLYTLVKDPVTKTYAIRYDGKLYRKIVDDFESKGHRQLVDGLLVWTPYIMGRSDREVLETKGHLGALAPRSDDEDEEAGEEAIEPGDQGAANAAKDSHATAVEQAGNDDLDDEHLSPKSQSRSARAISRAQSLTAPAVPEDQDPELVDYQGHVAPGPPSTEALTGVVSTQMVNGAQDDLKTNGLVSGDNLSGETPLQSNMNAGSDDNENAAPTPQDKQKQEQQVAPPSPPVHGYALAYRQHNIPPTRFQIDPPIPPSMLRQRSTKKRTATAAFGNTPKINGNAGSSSGAANSTIAVRSSPRHAGANGTPVSPTTESARGGRGSASPKVPSTPVRRSVRKSGLANVIAPEEEEEENDDDDDDDEEGEEEEAAPSKVDGEEASDSGEEESGDEATSAAVEDEDDDEEGSDDAEPESAEEADEEAVDADDDPNDLDAEPDEDEESESGSEEEDEDDPEADAVEDEEGQDDEDEDEDAEAEDDE